MGKHHTHNFDRRMQQLLESLPGLSLGHRERLLRPMKQSDIQAWEPLADRDLEDVLKVSLRTISHEIIDLFCVHIEGTLARCHTDLQRSLLSALLAHAIPLGMPVQLKTEEGLVGFNFPCAEHLTLERRTTTGSATGTTHFLLTHSRIQSGNAVPINCVGLSIKSPSSNVVHDLDHSVLDLDSPTEFITFQVEDLIENPFQCAATAFSRLFKKSST